MQLALYYHTNTESSLENLEHQECCFFKRKKPVKQFKLTFSFCMSLTCCDLCDTRNTPKSSQLFMGFLSLIKKKTLLGKEIFKNSKKKESHSRGILSSHEWCKNDEWRRAAAQFFGVGGDGSSPSCCKTAAGGFALQWGQVGQMCFCCWLLYHSIKHFVWIVFLQQGVLSSSGQSVTQIVHSWSSMT